MCLIIFDGNMFLWYFVDWWLNILVDGIDIMWIVLFCLVSLFVVFIVNCIFEFVLIRINFGVLL